MDPFCHCVGRVLGCLNRAEEHFRVKSHFAVSEPFGNLPKLSEPFRTLPNLSETFRTTWHLFRPEAQPSHEWFSLNVVGEPGFHRRFFHLSFSSGLSLTRETFAPEGRGARERCAARGCPLLHSSSFSSSPTRTPGPSPGTAGLNSAPATCCKRVVVEKKDSRRVSQVLLVIGAGDGDRTHDIQLGKLTLVMWK